MKALKIQIILLLKRFKSTALLYGLHQLVNKGYLKTQGWSESYFGRKPVDGFGKPIPWLSYPFISFLEPRLQKTFRVFEFGSGNSTYWLATRVKEVVSCEHDETWYQVVKAASEKFNNATIYLKPLAQDDFYQKEVTKHGKFHIIIIDGRERIQCSKEALNAIEDNGVIIWDNSDREKYDSGLKNLENHGFRRLDFFGLAPGGYKETCTTLFYKTNNCLNI